MSGKTPSPPSMQCASRRLRRFQESMRLDLLNVQHPPLPADGPRRCGLSRGAQSDAGARSRRAVPTLREYEASKARRVKAAWPASFGCRRCFATRHDSLTTFSNIAPPWRQSECRRLHHHRLPAASNQKHEMHKPRVHSEDLHDA